MIQIRLVAFIGWQRAGKTTAAKLLETNHGWTRTRFAGPLRAMLRALGLNDYWLEGEGKTQPCPLLGGRTPVHAMQTLGTEWGRELIDKDLWVNAWELVAEDVFDTGGRLCVDDLRFPNEANRILDMGGTIIRINRPGLERGSAHSSEEFTSKLTPHFEVSNDGTEAELEAKLLDILQ